MGQVRPSTRLFKLKGKGGKEKGDGKIEKGDSDKDRARVDLGKPKSNTRIAIKIAALGEQMRDKHSSLIEPGAGG